MTIKFAPFVEELPQLFWDTVAEWPLSSELAEGAPDPLLDLWIDTARRLQERERDLRKQGRRRA